MGSSNSMFPPPPPLLKPSQSPFASNLTLGGNSGALSVESFQSNNIRTTSVAPTFSLSGWDVVAKTTTDKAPPPYATTKVDELKYELKKELAKVPDVKDVKVPEIKEIKKDAYEAVDFISKRDLKHLIATVQESDIHEVIEVLFYLRKEKEIQRLWDVAKPFYLCVAQQSLDRCVFRERRQRLWLKYFGYLLYMICCAALSVLASYMAIPFLIK